jgi:membrane-bound lytic murein transglycosylase D
MHKRLVILLVGAGLLLGGCTGSGDKAEVPESTKVGAAQGRRPSRAEIEARVVQELQHFGEAGVFKDGRYLGPDGRTSYDIPITINADVEHAIDYFTNKIPKRFTIYLARSTRYDALMRGILNQYGLPEDLIYQALIESGFSCTAVSTASAVGPWQFIKGTATRYGLRVDPWVDERQDPLRSTHAAAKYLRDLRAEFGSWYLAAAAYNSGENKIRRALSLYQGNDYWSISHHPRSILANETKEYVPKLLAAAIIAKEPARYGFVDIPYESPLAYDEVTVHAGISISVLARAAGINTSDLAFLNPELKRGVTPPYGGIYTLRVPVGQAPIVERAYAQLTPAERNVRLVPGLIKAAKGDPSQSLAKSYGVSLPTLVAMNPRLNSGQLKPGQKVLVPGVQTASESKPALVARLSSASSPVVGVSSLVRTRYLDPSFSAPHRGAHKLTHVVAKGDTIWNIAQQYGLGHKEIELDNGIKNGQIALGQKLTLYVPPSKAEAKVETRAHPVLIREGREQIYRVQKGDTLWNISQRFNVSPGDIKRWNGMSDSSLSVGDNLKVKR